MPEPTKKLVPLATAVPRGLHVPLTVMFLLSACGMPAIRSKLRAAMMNRARTN